MWIDLLIVGWTVWWAKRGYRRGLPGELPRTLGVFIFGVTGFSLFYWTNAALQEMNKLTGQTAGGLSVVALFIFAKLAVRRFRQRLNELAAERWGDARPWGAAIGGVRAFMLSCIILAFFAEGPLAGVTRPVAKWSLVGRTLTWCLVPAERH
jgi:uncharacterized membrane protein required for colicin V production